MPARFEIYDDNDGRFRFRLVAANGEVVAESQSYASADAAHDGIEAVKRAAAEADTYQQGLLSMRHRETPES